MMKGILVAGIALTSFSALAQTGSFVTFMPENDLWMQDDLEATSKVTETIFKDIVQAGLDVYALDAQKNDETLVINSLWDNSTVNANCMRDPINKEVEINMYGGLARREEIIPESFALVLCHELGHAYGGEPYIRPATKVAAEGQADYTATLVCYEKIASKLPYLSKITNTTTFISKTCGKFLDDDRNDGTINADGTSGPKYSNCVGKLEGSQGLGKLLAVLGKDKIPNYETPDPYITPKTLTSYPKTTQCRLDTFLKGAMSLPRPACWFKN